jgi:hypothetical protein
VPWDLDMVAQKIVFRNMKIIWDLSFGVKKTA